MSQGKTEYKFQVNADMNMVETVIRNWLAANKFAQKPEFGSTVFAFNDPIVKGKRGFEYYINGNEVTILAYINTYKKPKDLEGAVGVLMKQGYKNDLAPLFSEIKKLESGATVNVNPAYDGAQAAGTSTLDSSLNAFMEKNNKSQETMVIVGFVMSILGLVFSCFGVTYGAILLVLEFYFAIQGLKTSKKGLAIATLVLAGLSILILIGYIVLIALFS